MAGLGGTAQRRPWVLRLGAVALGLVMALALAEVILRVFGLAPTGGVGTVNERQFASVPGLFAPNQRVVDRRHRRLAHRVHIDSLGYRGRDFPRAKPDGEFRILFAGDSFVYGDFVDDEATFPAQLETRVGRRCSAVRVVNAGVGGTTVVDAAKMIERGLALAPDLVILLFGENDIDDLGGPDLWERLAANRRAKSRFPLSVAYPILRRSALWNFGLSVVATVQTRGKPATDWSGRAPAMDALRARYRNVLREVRDTLAARRIPLLLVAYPSHHVLKRPELRGQLLWITETARAEGVPLVNVLPAFETARLTSDSLYLLPHDGHPSPRGYALAAEHLAGASALMSALGATCAGTR